MSQYLTRDEVLELPRDVLDIYRRRGWVDDEDIKQWEAYSYKNPEDVNAGPPEEVPPTPPGLLDKIIATGSAFGSGSVAGGAQVLADSKYSADQKRAALGVTNDMTDEEFVNQVQGKNLLGALFSNLLSGVDGETIDAVAKGRREDARRTLDSVGITNEDVLSDVAQVGESLAPLLAGIGTAMATKNPMLGAGVSVAPVLPSEYREGREQMKLSDEEASNRSLLMAAPELAMERLGFKYLLPRGAGAKVDEGIDALIGRNYATKVAGAAAAEAVTEAATYLAQTGLDASLYDKDPEDFLLNLRKAAVGGAVLGGPVRAVTALADAGIEPSGDDAFDAGQKAALDALVAEDKRLPNSGKVDLPPVAEQMELFGTPTPEETSALQSQQEAARKDREIDLGLRQGRATEARREASRSLLVDEVQQAEEIFNSYGKNIPQDKLAEAMGAKTVLEGKKKALLDFDNDVAPPSTPEPKQEVLPLKLSGDERKVKTMIQTALDRPKKDAAKEEKKAEKAAVAERKAVEKTTEELDKQKNKDESIFLRTRLAEYQEQGISPDEMAPKLLTDMNNFRKTWKPVEEKPKADKPKSPIKQTAARTAYTEALESGKTVEQAKQAAKMAASKATSVPEAKPTTPAATVDLDYSKMAQDVDSQDIFGEETTTKEKDAKRELIANAQDTTRGVTEGRDPLSFPDIEKATIADMKEGYGLNTSQETRWSSQFGDLYDIVIPDTNEFIDYTKSAAEQDQFVSDRLSGDEVTTKVLSSLPENATGRQIYEGVAAELAQRDGLGEALSPRAFKAASEHLAGLGIAGNTNWAPLGKRTGKRDFIVFSPKSVSLKTVAAGKKKTQEGIPMRTDPTGSTVITEALMAASNVGDVLKAIAENTTDKLSKTLVNRLRDWSVDSKIEIVDNIDGDDTILGQYNAGNDTISIRRDQLREPDSVLAWLITHEAGHAGTMKTLDTPDSKLNPIQRKAKRELIQLFKYLKDNHPELAKKYGMTNVKEFAAETWSNKKFQAALKKIKLPKNFGQEAPNMFQAFIDSVRRLLKMTDNSALTKAIDLVNQVGTAQAVANMREMGGATAPITETKANATREAITPEPFEIDMVYTDGEKNLGVHSPNRGRMTLPETLWKGFRNALSSKGNINPVIRESQEVTYSGAVIKAGLEGTWAAQRINNLIKRENDPALTKVVNEISKDPSNAIPKLREALKGRDPDLIDSISQAIKQIKKNAIDILRVTDENGTQLPDEIRQQIIKSAVDPSYLYFTRSYKINAARGEGKVYANQMARAMGAKLDGYSHIQNIIEKVESSVLFKGQTAKRLKEQRARMQKILLAVRNSEVAIPEDSAEMKKRSKDRIVALYETYFPAKNDYAGIKKDDLIAELSDYREANKDTANYSEMVMKNTERLVLDLLRLGDPDSLSKMAKIYTGERADLTIVKERDNVPEHIQELWGKYEDAAWNFYNTIHSQAEFIARQNTFKEFSAQIGKTLFNERSDVHTAQLKGETFGPLQNKWVTPEMKNYLDSRLEKTEGVEGVFSDLTGGAKSQFAQRIAGALVNVVVAPVTMAFKAASLSGNIALSLINAMGSGLLILRTGNITGRGVGRGFTMAKNAFLIARKKPPLGSKEYAAWQKKMEKTVLEGLRLGIMDSVQVGEISEQQMLATLGDIAPDNRWLKTLKEGAVDWFALSDAWTKMVDYYYQRDTLESAYKAMGREVDSETLNRQAAERAKKANFSYLRVPPGAKILEQLGGLLYTSYFYETWRTTKEGYKMVVGDFQRAKALREAGFDKAANIMATHATKRAAGLTTAITVAPILIQKGLSLLVSMFTDGDDDEDEREIAKAAMYADSASPLPVYWGKDDKGNRIYFDASRMDPVGPVGETLRGLFEAISMGMDGDPRALNQIIDSANSQIVENNAVRDVLLVANHLLLGGKPVRPGGISNHYPETYEKFQSDMVKLGVDPSTVDSVYKLSRLKIPRSAEAAFFQAMESFYTDRERPAALMPFTALGMPLIMYEPASNLNMSARGDFGVPVGDQRRKIKDYVARSAANLDGGFLEAQIRTLADQEFESFLAVQEKAQAAQKAGLNRGMARQILTEAGMTELQANNILNNRFRVSGITPEMIDQWRESELNDARGDPKKMEEIRSKYPNLRRSLLELTRKYRDQYDQALKE